jgi:hypothetical protein
VALRFGCWSKPRCGLNDLPDSQVGQAYWQSQCRNNMQLTAYPIHMVSGQQTVSSCECNCQNSSGRKKLASWRSTSQHFTREERPMCPAHEAVEYIGELFAMERAATSAGDGPEQRHALRQAQAPPILDKIRVRRARTRISPETRRTQAFDTVQPVLAARTRFSSENFGIGRSSIPRRPTNIPFGDSSGV